MCNYDSNNSETHQPPEVTEKLNQLLELLRIVNLTRLNRIQASNRLLETEHFVQHINIYYSCVASVITVLSLKYPDKSYGVASAIMTVALAISIVYLNAQKYGSRAQQLQMNYLALHQLRFDIENAISDKSIGELKDLQDNYVHLLQTSENHIGQDYRRTLWMNDRKRKREEKLKDKGENQLDINPEKQPEKVYIPKLFGLEWIKYFAREICWLALKIILWVLPLVYFVLVALRIL